MKNLPALRASGPVLFALLTTLILLAVSLSAAPTDGVSEKPATSNQFSAQSLDPQRFPAPPDDMLYPEVWVKSGQPRMVESYVINWTEEELEVAVSYDYTQGPAPWMTVSPGTLVLPPMTVTPVTVTLNPGGVIDPPTGTTVTLEGSFSFQVTSSPYPMVGSVAVKTIVADTVVPVTIDTITTGMGVSLTVASNGNAGNSAIPRVSMDFLNSGLECEDYADHYMFDLTPIVMVDSSALSAQPYYWESAPHLHFDFAPVPGSPAQSFSDPDFNARKTEMFVTADSTVGLIKTWYAPTDNVSFIIERMDVFSFDSETHPGVRIGEWIDWDIPQDAGHDNRAGYSLNYGTVDYLWMEGVDMGVGCHDDSRRFAASGILRWYYASERDNPDGPGHVGLLGGHVLKYELLDFDGTSPYYDSFIPHDTWTMLVNRSLTTSESTPFDGKMLLAFGSFDVSEDTVSIWLVHATLYDGDEEILLQTMQDANTWYIDHFAPPPYCCGLYRNGLPGNADCDPTGKVNLADVTKLIDRIYLSKSRLCCEANGDVNCDGRINLADVTRLIGLVYHTGPSELCSCRGR